MDFVKKCSLVLVAVLAFSSSHSRAMDDKIENNRISKQLTIDGVFDECENNIKQAFLSLKNKFLFLENETKALKKELELTKKNKRDLIGAIEDLMCDRPEEKSKEEPTVIVTFPSHSNKPLELPSFKPSIINDIEKLIIESNQLLIQQTKNLNKENEELKLKIKLLEQKSIEKPTTSELISPHSHKPLQLPFLKTVPLIAQGHEQIYERFLKGKLIYKPDPESDKGRIDLPIAALTNPLEGTFDLSQCGDTGKYLSISTGYRKGKKLENEDKVEIWFVPRFLVEKEINSTASHFAPIMSSWDAKTAPIGLLFTWGGWDNLGWFDYLTTHKMEMLGDENLYQKRREGTRMPRWRCGMLGVGRVLRDFTFCL